MEYAKENWILTRRRGFAFLHRMASGRSAHTNATALIYLSCFLYRVSTNRLSINQCTVRGVITVTVVTSSRILSIKYDNENSASIGKIHIHVRDIERETLGKQQLLQCMRWLGWKKCISVEEVYLRWRYSAKAGWSSFILIKESHV